MKKTLIRPLTAGFAFALATGFSGSVFAQTATAPVAKPAAEAQADAGKPGKGPHGKPGARHEMKRDALFIPGVGPLPKAQADALALTAEQQKLVDELRTSQQAAHEKMRAAHEARRTALQAQLADNKLDPRALIKVSDDARDTRAANAKAFEKQGLAVWDSLNEKQRGQVTAFVKARQDKMAQRHADRARERSLTPPTVPTAR